MLAGMRMAVGVKMWAVCHRGLRACLECRFLPFKQPNTSVMSAAFFSSCSFQPSSSRLRRPLLAQRGEGRSPASRVRRHRVEVGSCVAEGGWNIF